MKRGHDSIDIGATIPFYHQNWCPFHSGGAPAEAPRTRSPKRQSRVRDHTTEFDNFCLHIFPKRDPNQTINTATFWFQGLVRRCQKGVLEGVQTNM